MKKTFFPHDGCCTNNFLQCKYCPSRNPPGGDSGREEVNLFFTCVQVQLQDPTPDMLVKKMKKALSNAKKQWSGTWTLVVSDGTAPAMIGTVTLDEVKEFYHKLLLMRKKKHTAARPRVAAATIIPRFKETSYVVFEA